MFEHLLFIYLNCFLRTIFVLMLFQPELSLSILDLLGRSANSVRWTPLQKQETKRIGGGSPVASPMPKSVLSEGRENQLLRE